MVHYHHNTAAFALLFKNDHNKAIRVEAPGIALEFTDNLYIGRGTSASRIPHHWQLMQKLCCRCLNYRPGRYSQLQRCSGFQGVWNSLLPCHQIFGWRRKLLPNRLQSRLSFGHAIRAGIYFDFDVLLQRFLTLCRDIVTTNSVPRRRPRTLWFSNSLIQDHEHRFYFRVMLPLPLGCKTTPQRAAGSDFPSRRVSRL